MILGLLLALAAFCALVWGWLMGNITTLLAAIALGILGVFCVIGFYGDLMLKAHMPKKDKES